MPTLAAISARDRAVEMVLVLHLLTILSILLALQLEHASTLPSTVWRVAGCTLIGCRSAVVKIGGPFTIEGGVLLNVFQLPTVALPRVRLGLWRPPSKTLSKKKSLPCLSWRA